MKGRKKGKRDRLLLCICLSVLCVLAFVPGTGCTNKFRDLAKLEDNDQSPVLKVSEANCTKSDCYNVKIMTAYGAFIKAGKELENIGVNCTANTQPCQKLMRQYVDAGITLSDNLCEDFFIDKFHLYKRLNFAQDSVNAGGATAATILALTGNPLPAIGATAAGVAFLNMELQFSKQAFLVDNAFEVLYTNLKSGREKIAHNVRNNTNNTCYMNYASVRGAIYRYHSTCSPASIAYYIADSIKKTQLIPDEQVSADKRISELTTQLNILLTGNSGSYTAAQLNDYYCDKSKVNANMRANVGNKTTQTENQAAPIIMGYLSELSNLVQTKASRKEQSINLVTDVKPK